MPVNGVVEPSITEKRPFVTCTRLALVSDSVHSAVEVAAEGEAIIQKRML